MKKIKKPSCEIEVGEVLIDKYAIKNDYFLRLAELAMNMYQWTGLPKSVDARFLELTINKNGAAGFYFDEFAERYVGLTVNYGAPLTIYNTPTDIRAYASNGYDYSLNLSDCVLIYNNYMRTPTFPTLAFYADTLGEIEMSIRSNVKNQKFPLIVQTTEGQRLTVKNLFQKVDDDEHLIFGDKNLDLSGAKVLKTDAPFVADKLELMKAWYWNEVLTFLGIENSNTQKGERLITDEVKSSLGNTIANRNVRLNMRQQACREINDMFGLNVWVEYRKQPWESEVLENGSIYNNDTQLEGNELQSRIINLSDF